MSIRCVWTVDILAQHVSSVLATEHAIWFCFYFSVFSREENTVDEISFTVLPPIKYNSYFLLDYFVQNSLKEKISEQIVNLLRQPSGYANLNECFGLSVVEASSNSLAGWFRHGFCQNFAFDCISRPIQRDCISHLFFGKQKQIPLAKVFWHLSTTLLLVFARFHIFLRLRKYFARHYAHTYDTMRLQFTQFIQFSMWNWTRSVPRAWAIFTIVQIFFLHFFVNNKIGASARAHLFAEWEAFSTNLWKYAKTKTGENESEAEEEKRICEFYLRFMCCCIHKCCTAASHSTAKHR